MGKPGVVLADFCIFFFVPPPPAVIECKRKRVVIRLLLGCCRFGFRSRLRHDGSEVVVAFWLWRRRRPFLCIWSLRITDSRSLRCRIPGSSGWSAFSTESSPPSTGCLLGRPADWPCWLDHSVLLSLLADLYAVDFSLSALFQHHFHGTDPDRATGGDLMAFKG